jgi:hypothetical protein
VYIGQYLVQSFAPAIRTGTFFCEMTTAQSLPRTPNDVMFAAVIALNAYSGSCVSGASLAKSRGSIVAPAAWTTWVAYRLGIDDLGPRRW